MTPTLAPALLPGARGCIHKDDDGRAVYQFEAISPKIVPSNRAEAMRAEPVCCAQRLSDNASHALTRDGPRVFLSSWFVRRGRRPRPRRMPRSSTRAPRTRAPRVGRSQFASDYRASYDAQMPDPAARAATMPRRRKESILSVSLKVCVSRILTSKAVQPEPRGSLHELR